jgi:hypothetical protein
MWTKESYKTGDRRGVPRLQHLFKGKMPELFRHGFTAAAAAWRIRISSTIRFNDTYDIEL